jgi:hypothetical protein
MNCCDYHGHCRQGRDCPVRATRLRTSNGGEQVDTQPARDADELPVVMFEEPYAWMAESIQRAKEMAIALALIAASAGVASWLFGCFRP